MNREDPEKREKQTWAIIGGVIAVFLIILTFYIAKYKFYYIEAIAILNLAFLMLHQFEEYVVPGGFKDFFNRMIYNPVGLIHNRLNNKSIFLVNVVLGWGVYSIGMIYLSLPFSYVLVMVLVWVNMINGLIHLSFVYRLKRYNPGLITSVLLLIPFGILSINSYMELQLMTKWGWAGSFLGALLGIWVVPLIINLARSKERKHYNVD